MGRISFDKSLRRFTAVGLTLVAIIAVSLAATAQADAERQIEKQLGTLRAMKDSDRAVATKNLALSIRALTPSARKVLLANGLANLSTEGDFGRDTLQEVTTTLARSVAETPAPDSQGGPNFAYLELAQLSKYEHMRVSLNSPSYRTAQANLAAIDRQRAQVDFTLMDVHGNNWKLSDLKGKVVLVNFWATWCPPCRKEMPDLQTLYDRFKDQGFVILAISDEKPEKVNPFIADHKYTYPVLLDPGRSVNTQYKVDGIPKSFIYDRKGNMVAQTIDMRTQAQFLALLAKAGLK